MQDHELIELVLHNREERNLEYKGGMNWADPNTKAHITKTVLSMSNIRDGGAIVIGIEQDGEVFRLTGLQATDLDSFTQDGVSSHVNQYADPFAEITVSKATHASLNFVVIQVKEFPELPVICKRNGAGGLRQGAIYTRTHRMHESTEVQTQTEMREIIDAAIEKRIRSLNAMLGRMGLAVIGLQAEDRRRFDEQLGGL
jgi:hypothetical protein